MLKQVFIMFVIIYVNLGCGNNLSQTYSVKATKDGATNNFPQTTQFEDLIIYEQNINTPVEVIMNLQRNLSFVNDNGGNLLREDDPFNLISKIINIGKEIWSIIEQNKPVVNVAHDFASAIPQCVTAVNELQNFSDLQFKSFRIWGKNLLGQTVFDIVYTLVHQYGGTYKGIGQFLTNVTVIPSKVDVMFGYSVNFKVVNVSSINVGSEENPVGSVIMHLKLTASSLIKYYENNKVFQFRGDSATVTKISQ